MRRRVVRCAVGACLLGIGLSACGGGGSDNEAPTASAVSISTTEDTPVQGVFSGSDLEGSALTATVATPPSKGDVAISSANPLAFTYTPRPNQNGTDSFTYRLNDGSGNSEPATVSVSIAAVPDAPLIMAVLAVDEDTALRATVVTEPDGDSFTFQIVTQPAHGTLVAGAVAGTYVYTPEPNFNGADSFSVTAVDSNGLTSDQTVVVRVRPINDAPVAVNDDVHTVQGASSRFDPRTNDLEVDGDALTVSITTGPSVGTATVNADGSIQYTGTASFVGSTSLTYELRDPSGATASGTMSIGVGFTHGAIYLAGDTNDTSKGALYFTDGVRRFQVSPPLRPGEYIYDVKIAKDAPVVVYQTNLATVNRLYRADLRVSTTAQEIESPSAYPGVNLITMTDDGMCMLYSGAGTDTFVDYRPSSPIKGAVGARRSGSFLNPSCTRQYFLDQQLQPYMHWAAMFWVPPTGGLATQVTPSLSVNTMTTGSPEYLSNDQRRLYYRVFDGVGSKLMVVDPDLFGSESLVLDSAVKSVSWLGTSPDEAKFWGREAFGGPRLDYYLVTIGAPASYVNLTGDTNNGTSRGYMTADFSRFYYDRTNSSGLGTRIYGVDTSNPSVSFPVGGTLPASYYGVESFTVGKGANMIFATVDLVPLSGGGMTSGNSDVYYVDLAQPNTPRLLGHFAGAASARAHSPDDSVAVFSGARDVEHNIAAEAWFVNLRDTSQLVPWIVTST